MGAATSYLKALFGATEKENEWDKKSRPIHFAANDGKPLLIKILLWKGAGVDAKDEDGLTALHLAAENGHIDAVNALLAGGARIDAQDNRTWEALHLAAQNGHVEMIKLLLHAGA
ncbi:ankyrin protein, partial [Xylogone sp. PMI_703]